jgi:hypothetical protein
MKRLALLAAAAALALAAGVETASAQSSPSIRNPYAGSQPLYPTLGLSGTARSIRDPSAGTLAPVWLDRTSVTDPTAGMITPDGFAKYSSLTAAIAAEPVGIAPSGTLLDSVSPALTAVPTLSNSYGTPFRPYQAPTNAYSTPYTTFANPQLTRPAPAAYGSVQIPSTISPAEEAAADVASGEYLPRPDTGFSRQGRGEGR